jgi:hypothetical protein
MIVSCGVVGYTSFPERSITRKVDRSANYVNHYARYHLELPRSKAEEDHLRKNLKTTFFASRKQTARKEDKEVTDEEKSEFWRLLINFVVKNNLLFRVVEQPATVALF